MPVEDLTDPLTPEEIDVCRKYYVAGLDVRARWIATIDALRAELDSRHLQLDREDNELADRLKSCQEGERRRTVMLEKALKERDATKKALETVRDEFDFGMEDEIKTADDLDGVEHGDLERMIIRIRNAVCGDG